MGDKAASGEIPFYPVFDERTSDISTEWEDWLEGLEAMFALQTFTKDHEDEEKFDKLFYYLRTTRKILKKLENNGVAGRSYKLANEALTKYFCPGKTSFSLLHKLYHTKQNKGETMDSFYHRVRDVMDSLDLTKKKVEEIEELLIIAQLVNCTNDDGIRRKTLRTRGAIKLTEFLDRARSDESALRESSEISGSASGAAAALAVKKQYNKKKSGQNTQPSGSSSTKKTSAPTQPGKCTFCGGGPHDRRRCPARNSVCHNCENKGHFVKVCMKPKYVHEVVENNSHSEVLQMQETFLGVVDTNKGAVSRKVTEVIINGISTPMRIDTGAEATLIDSRLYAEKFSSEELLASDCVFRGAKQGQFSALGFFNAVIQYGSNKVKEPIYVIENASNLLSCRSSTALGLVVFTCSVSTYREQYPTLFNGLGKLEKTYKIQLREDAVPYEVMTPRHVSHGLHDKVGTELKRLQNLGVITPVNEPTDWCAPVVVVPKPNGDVRLCVDLTKLNKAVKRPRHVMPSVDYVLGQIGQAKVFSKLDANSGYHQVELDEDSRLLTTFITSHGRFAYNRLPFGISSAPEFYQKQVSSIIAGLAGVVCLMDDIVVSGKDEAEHDQRLQATLSRLAAAGITLNKDKCVFKQSSISFLGQIVSSEGIKADPAKVAAIKEMSAPTDVSELRRFIGMVNHLGKFTPDLSTVIQPLRELLSKKNEWFWGPSQQVAFDNIKDMLSNTPVLALYKPELDTKVSADSSSYGLGAVLMQKNDSQWRPVAYASRSLSETERRYAQIEKEALAM